MTKFNIRNRSAVIVASAWAMLAGCHHDSSDNANHGEAFRPQTEVRETGRLLETQKAVGARDDATLYPKHFDGPMLSSLGATKLDLMLEDSRSTDPLVVYLAVPEDDDAQARRAAIGNYLTDRGGLKTEQIKFQEGPNPASYAASVPNIKNYGKTETSSDSGGSSAGSAGGQSSSH